MMTFEEMAVLDVTVKEYSGRRDEKRFYVPMDDLPWDYEKEEFWPENDEIWNWWEDEVRRKSNCEKVLKVEFRCVQWNDKLDTFYVKEF